MDDRPMPRSTSLWMSCAALALIGVTLWLLRDDASMEGERRSRRASPAIDGGLADAPALGIAPLESSSPLPISRELVANIRDEDVADPIATGDAADESLRIAIYCRSPLELGAYAMVWPGPPPSSIENLDVGLLDDQDLPIIESALVVSEFEGVADRILLSPAEERAVQGVVLDDPEMRLVMVISDPAIDDHRAAGKPIWVTVHRPGGGVQTIVRRVAPSEKWVTLTVDVDGWVWAPDFVVGDGEEPMTIAGWYAGDLEPEWTLADDGNGFAPMPDGSHPFSLTGKEEGRLHWSMVDVRVVHGKETLLRLPSLEDVVRGRVCDEAGRPVESHIRVDGRGGTAAEFETLEDGSFRITGNLVGMESFRVTPLATDRYGIVEVSPPAGRDFHFVVSVPTHADRLVTVHLNLRDGQGGWVNSQVGCTLIGKEAGWVTRTQALASGCVTYHPGMSLTPPGSYDLWVWMPEAAMFVAQAVEVKTYEAGQRQTVRAIPEPAEGIVRGRVVGFSPSRPWSLFWYLRPPGLACDVKPSSSFTMSEAIGKDGAFELRGLPRGLDFVIELTDGKSVFLTIDPPTLPANQPVELGDIRVTSSR